MITLTIDGEQVKVKEGTSILEAAKLVNIKIPHLCYLKGLRPDGSCGLCIVEIDCERWGDPLLRARSGRRYASSYQYSQN